MRLLLHLALICITLTADITYLHYIFTALNVTIIFNGDSVLFSLLFHLNTLGYSGKQWPICCWNFRKSKPEFLIEWKALAPEKNTCSWVIEFRAQTTQKEEVSLQSFILSHTNFTCEFLVSHICSLLITPGQITLGKLHGQLE